MDRQSIISAITPALTELGCFLVDVSVSADNDVTLTIEKETGAVSMDDCVALDRAFHALFNQDEEDYALTVTSAGLDQPFQVLRQYLKAIGTEVEVSVRGGRKFTATLLAADEGAITVRYSAREAVDGKKKKELVTREETLPLETLTRVRPHITME